MNGLRWLALIIAMSPGLAQAQAPNPFVGRWTVTWTGDKQENEAELVISETGMGSWYRKPAKKRDPCRGIEIPISFEATGPDAARVRTFASKVVAGCNDHVLTLRRTESGASGQFDDAEARFTRK